MYTCHFLTMEHILSRVRSMPWKLVRQFLPCTSSVTSLNLRKATSSFCRSARLTSNTRPFRPSEAISKLQRHGVKFSAVCNAMMNMDFMGMSGDLTTVIIVFHLGPKLLSSCIPTAIWHILIRIKQLGCMPFIVQQDLPFPSKINNSC